ncbi:MAG: SseB family protein [Blautia sp.]|nr:SseB family protein [Blautia sp.]
MAKTTEQIVRELLQAKSIFAAYSQATKMPFVTCDPVSFNDQIWLFSSQDLLKEFAKKQMEEKNILMGMRYDQKDYRHLFSTLLCIDVNSVMFVNEEGTAELPLSSFVHRADPENVPKEKRPFLNPQLQLCGLYFMQELRRPVPPQERKNLKAQEEELIAILKRSQFLVPMEVTGEEEKRISVPYLKNKEGDILQPIFSDSLEFQRFAQGKKLRAAKVDFAKLPGLLLEQAKGMVINPKGFNLILNRDQLKRIAQQN